MTKLQDLGAPKQADVLGQAWTDRITAELARVLEALNDETEISDRYIDLVSCAADLHAMLGGVQSDAVAAGEVTADEGFEIPDDYMRQPSQLHVRRAALGLRQIR